MECLIQMDKWCGPEVTSIALIHISLATTSHMKEKRVFLPLVQKGLENWRSLSTRNLYQAFSKNINVEVFLAWITHESVNYKLALTKSIANNWTTKAFATASMEIEPHAALDVGLQQSLRELRVAWGTLCSRESLGSWMFLETDFMISILASPHI